MAELTPTPRTTLRSLPARGSHDRALIDRILDEALVCHVGFAVDGQPYVLPMSYARTGEALVLHGAKRSRALLALAAGAPACITVTLIDGLVLGRSAFHHSVNYRSVVILGRGLVITRREEKRAALTAILDHALPGRSSQGVRPPSDAELDATLVLSFPIEEASAKVRSGPPVDAAKDLALDCWAGVVPLKVEAGPAIPDAGLHPDTPTPDSIARWRRPR